MSISLSVSNVEKAPNVEETVMAIRRNRRELASRERWLEAQSGLSPDSFKQAIIRILRKNLAVKWKNERFDNFLVAVEFANYAYYTEVIESPTLWSQTPTRVTLHRSIPFVVLQDEDKVPFNRYRLLDAEVASVA